MQPTLDLLNISYKTNGKAILEDINLSFGTGIHALLGLNGAGKTSLFNIIATLQKPTSGEMLYKDSSIIKNPKSLRKDLGYMSQNVGLIQDFSIEQNLYYFGLMKGCLPKDLKQKIPNLLETLNLQREKGRKVFNLSGGMKQRIGIALALLNNPEVLLLDEPINNLDDFEREKFYHFLQEIAQNSIVIISTHLVNEISNFCDKIIVMKNGRVGFCGTANTTDEVQEIFKQHTR
ncbi:MAG: ATP-binding cassette domain-containing protein [Cruoricaptor ignavus]|nr:ATP-binding cassette domain-containing protein [Cruoricaptor ignavus]